MQTRQQILHKLKDRNLTNEQRERLQQHLFHLDQSESSKREASPQKKEHHVRKNFKHDDGPSNPTATES